MLNLTLIAALHMICCTISSFAASAQKPLTILIYAAGDNNLSQSMLYNVKQMKEVHNPQINILVYLFLPPTADGIKKTYKLCVTHGKASIVGIDYNQDSGDEKSLTAACKWALDEYPATYFGVIASDHGSGIISRWPDHLLRGFCYDDTTGHYLDDVKLMRSLTTVVQTYRGGKKIDFFGFDACLMAHQEIATALAPYAQYMVASQQTELADGWPYTDLLSNFVDPVSFVKNSVSAYQRYYTTVRKTKDFTLSAFDLQQVDLVNKHIDDLSISCIEALNSPQAAPLLRTMISSSVKSFFAERTSLDIDYFCTKLSASAATITHPSISIQNIFTKISAQARSLKTQLNKLIIANTQGPAQPFAQGASLYFPIRIIEPSYITTYFKTVSQWPNFLKTYMYV